jgi:hypothetical protein
MKKLILFILLFATILSSCSIEKRVYQSGYYISGRSSSPKEEKIQKQLLPVIFSESVTTITKEDSSKVIEHEDTASIRLNESYPRIESSHATQIPPHEIPISAILASDSIPNESKVLNEKYEKNHALKNKIRKIAHYPLVVAMYAFYMTWLIFLIYLFSTMSSAVLVASLAIFAAALILVIPLASIYLVLSIITKKQRRKLRKMGVVK